MAPHKQRYKEWRAEELVLECEVVRDSIRPRMLN